MPDQAVNRIVSSTGSIEGKKILILGASYRGGVKESALSGAFGICKRVEELGGVPLVHDPLFSDAELLDLGFMPFSRGDSAECVILQADHTEYQDWMTQDVRGVKLLLDGRNVLNPGNWPGVQFMVIGKPNL
jgi:UDP-N-acetyl-D-mannosaminuronate dehydrogenase